jgi:tripartite-type tricarboxylate transporter receptor subunit TctC
MLFRTKPRRARAERRRRSTPFAGLLGACSLLLLAGPGSADEFPSRPIRLVVGFTAGGPTDVPARFLADRVSASIGKPVIVENKPGAGSMLAIRDVLSKPRDGYNLLTCSYLDPVNTLLYRSAGYTIADIEPITITAEYDYAIALANDIPANTITELVAYTKKNPDKVNYGHLGAGSYQNILAKQLEKLTGMKMTAIPYKGAADALQEIVAGRNHLYFGPPVVTMPLYEGKKLKVIASTGKTRLASAPEVPTLQESGIPLVTSAWLGICAGAGTSRPIVDLLNKHFTAALQSPEYKELVQKSGSVPASSTPEEFRAVIEKTAADVAPIIKEFKLQLD